MPTLGMVRFDSSVDLFVCFLICDHVKLVSSYNRPFN